MRDAEVGRLAQMERLRWRTPVCPWGNCFIIRCQARGSLCDPFVRVFLASGFSSHSVQPRLLVLVLLLLLNSLTRSSKTTEPVKSIRWPVIWTEQSMVICLWTEVVVGAMVLKKTLHMWKRSPQAHGQSPIGQDSRQSAGSNSFPVKRICERDAKELAEGARRNDAGAAVVVDSFPEKPAMKQNKNEDGKTRQKIANTQKQNPVFSLQKKV